MRGQDTSRRNHHGSGRHLKVKSRDSVQYSVKVQRKGSASRKQSSQQQLEAIDLLCPELLPLLDAHGAQTSDSEVSDFCADSIPDTTGKLAALPESIRYKHNRYCHLRRGVEDRKLQILPTADLCKHETVRWSTGEAVSERNFSVHPGLDCDIGCGLSRYLQGDVAGICTLGSSRQYKLLEFISGSSISLKNPENSSLYISAVTKREKVAQTGEGDQSTEGNFACRCKSFDMLLQRENQTCYQLSTSYVQKLKEAFGPNIEHNELRVARRRTVGWMFEAMKILRLRFLTGANAVSILDRYLSQCRSVSSQDPNNNDLSLAALACLWIAAKLDDIDAPDISIFQIVVQGLTSFYYEEEKIQNMEMSVLTTLGWRLLAANVYEFLATMVSHLEIIGLPPHILHPVGIRSEELIQGILSEVEFLAFQPSVVSICVMQCVLDEYAPVHTTSVMQAFHMALAVNVKSTKACHRALVDLVVDPDLVSCLPSPDRVHWASYPHAYATSMACKVLRARPN